MKGERKSLGPQNSLLDHMWVNSQWSIVIGFANSEIRLLLVSKSLGK